MYPARRVASQCTALYQHLPLTAPQYEIHSEGECRLDEVLFEVGPCEEWMLDELELNTVTISNMCIDCKLVETGGNRGRYRESPLTLVRENQL